MPLGKIVWFDLMTTKPDAAPAFYAEIFGWKADVFPGYTQLTAPDGKGMGGIAELPAEAAAAGAPPHWNGYTQVADVDATVAKATSLGAQVYVPPTDIPNTGRFAVLADPQGASFAVYAAGGQRPDNDDQSGLGHFSWCELATSDLAGAQAFYGELFGWKKVSSMDMGPDMGSYDMFGFSESEMLGGMMKRPPQMPVSAWVYYFRVADCDAAYAKAKALGATDRYPPMDIPGGGRACLVADPQGATFGIVHEPKS